MIPEQNDGMVKEFAERQLSFPSGCGTRKEFTLPVSTSRTAECLILTRSRVREQFGDTALRRCTSSPRSGGTV